MALFDRRESENIRDDIDSELKELMLSLGSKDWKIRENAAIRLTEIGKPAIVYLLKSLDSDNSLVQTGAAEVLGTYGEAALPTLLKLVTTGKERVRDGAARAIGQNGDRALLPLKEALQDKDYKARRGAALSLGYLGYLGKEIEELLIGMLEDENEEVRIQAATSLENLNWKPNRRSQMALYYNAKNDLNALAKLGKDSIPILKKEIIGSNTEKKKYIAGILPRIIDEQGLILLIKLLEDSDNQVRQKAVEAIGDSGDKRLVQYLVKALEDSDSYVRMEAAWALDKTGWKPSGNGQKARYLIVREKWTDLLQMREAALPYLIESLKDKNPGVRLKSTEVLRAMGNTGYAAINEALKSEDPELKKGAAEAASLIKKKNAEAASVKPDQKQKTPDEEVEEQLKRQKATMAARNTAKEDFWASLMRKNGLDEERVLRFSKALSDKNEIVRAAAIENLKSAGNAGAECMIILLSDEKNTVKIAAIESLGDMKVKKAAPYLVKLTKDKNENIRMASAHSLGQIGEPKTLPAIIKLFSDTNSSVRKEASDSAARFGNFALVLLKNTFLEQDMTVRMTAIRSVSKIIDSSSISLCVRMLNDSEFDVRECAVKALRILSENLFNSLIDESQRIVIQGTFMEKSGMIAALSGIEDLRAKEAVSVFKSDPNEAIRNRATDALQGKQPDNKVVPKKTSDISIQKKTPKAQEAEKYSAEIRNIIAGLKSDDNNIQMKAAEQVFLIGDDMIEPLIDSLNEDNPALQNFIAEILTGLGDKAIEGLIQALKTGKQGVKLIAAQNLGKIPEDNTIDALCEVLYHESDPVVRKVAAESLGFLGDSRSVEALVFAAREEDKTVKAAALRSLGYMGDTKVVPTLIDAYADEDANISTIATEALRNYGAFAIEHLTAALNSEGTSGKTGIAQALDELNWVPETEESIAYYLIAKKQWKELVNIGKPAIKPLLEAITDSDPDVRMAVVETIAEIGGEEAVNPLAKALCDNSPAVRKKAEASIFAIGKKAVPILEKIVANAKNPTERTFTMSLIRKLES
ncbi:MAG: HEAT repeat domain-containing protein [Methanomicrobium sp.]|nr:HEAT repeat domain-containing protein [Methanomicrobium sp.]